MFDDKYEIIAQLGQGGFATVYKVRDKLYGNIRALRVLNQRVLDSNDKVYRNWLRECGILMRQFDGRYLLIDFGLAIQGENGVIKSSRHEHGAPEYMAPEKWDNEALLTEQSDIYSFVILMYQCLAGRVPFAFNYNASNSISEMFAVQQVHKTKKPESTPKSKRKVKLWVFLSILIAVLVGVSALVLYIDFYYPELWDTIVDEGAVEEVVAE